TRIRLAHADGERQLAAGDGRQEALALRLGAEAEEERPALPLGHPVSAGRRAGRQQLLQQNVALEEGALLAAVLLRPREPDPAARTELLAERGIEAAPRARPAHRGPRAQRLAQEDPHLVP